jgi:FixJ family two-component response regulator
MTTGDHIVFIVDDDAPIREALGELLESHGMRALVFGSAGDYVSADKPDVPACLILDVELPDINGLDLQRQIAEGDHPPIVFITGHGDIPSSVRAIKHGAVDFLTKPFSDADLMAAIDAAIAQDREIRSERAELGVLRQRYTDLTRREREVLPLVVSGLLNKQAAAELGSARLRYKPIEGTSCRKWRRRRLPISCVSRRDWKYRSPTRAEREGTECEQAKMCRGYC